VRRIERECRIDRRLPFASNRIRSRELKLPLTRRPVRRKLASRPKSSYTRNRVFLIAPLAAESHRKSNFPYDELVSGRTVYAYALSNPVSKIDPTGLDVSIVITRGAYTSESVIGTISVTSTVAGAGSFNGYTLEAATAGPLGNKDPIPAGTYGGFIRTDHSPNRIELENVPGFQNIQIHNGNTADDVEGCFAVGTKQRPNQVLNSLAALNKILDIINNDGSGNITVQVIGPSTAPAPVVP
jgi:hypothetical protein